MRARPPEERFWEKVAINPRGCWEWIASVDGHYYGHFGVYKKTVKAHRFAYELMVGPIPKGLQIDHLCRNRRCVNPDHLEPVTNKENSNRGISHNTLKTHCINGHPYSKENTYIRPNGDRDCITCKRYYRKRWYQLLKQ